MDNRKEVKRENKQVRSLKRLRTLKSKGKTNLKPMALKLYMNRDEEFEKKDFMNKELFWPVLEKS